MSSVIKIDFMDFRKEIVTSLSSCVVPDKGEVIQIGNRTYRVTSKEWVSAGDLLTYALRDLGCIVHVKEITR